MWGQLLTMRPPRQNFVSAYRQAWNITHWGLPFTELLRYEWSASYFSSRVNSQLSWSHGMILIMFYFWSKYFKSTLVEKFAFRIRIASYYQIKSTMVLWVWMNGFCIFFNYLDHLKGLCWIKQVCWEKYFKMPKDVWKFIYPWKKWEPWKKIIKINFSELWRWIKE